VLREGLAGGAFHVITSGEASVRIAGAERARLLPGDFFGEISILSGEPAASDVVVVSEELRAAVLPGAELRPLLRRHPDVAVRMLEIGTRRLARANLWRP
jgi:CRP-like cAMP-binding protein